MGSPVDGLRLGIAYGSDASKLTLRVSLQNVGSEFRDVVIGHQAGGPIYDSLKFIVATPDGKRLELLHRSLYTAIAGLILPFSVGLTVSLRSSETGRFGPMEVAELLVLVKRQRVRRVR